MDFSQIVLSRQQYETLKKLYSAPAGKAICVDKKNFQTINELIQLGFANLFFGRLNGKMNVNAPKYAVITDLGKSYWLYTRESRTQSKRNAWRDVFCALIGAVTAFILEHLFPLLLSFIQSLDK